MRTPLPSSPEFDQERLAARRILSVTEEELQRIVLDIHDGPVQHLFAALAQLRILQRRREQGELISEHDWDEHITRQADLLEEVLREIRDFLGTFRSPSFLESQLPDIIRGLVLQHETFTGCRVELMMGDDFLPISLPIKIALYRICQEALSNAYRHSGADRQWVRLMRDGGAIVLEVRDSGRGFEPPTLQGPQATEEEKHIGLRGMRDRLAIVGGKLEVDSAPGQGARIIARVLIDE